MESVDIALIKRYTTKRYRIGRILYDKNGFVISYDMIEKYTDNIITTFWLVKFLSEIFGVEILFCNKILKLILDEHIEALKENQLTLNL